MSGCLWAEGFTFRWLGCARHPHQGTWHGMGQWPGVGWDAAWCGTRGGTARDVAQGMAQDASRHGTVAHDGMWHGTGWHGTGCVVAQWHMMGCGAGHGVGHGRSQHGTAWCTACDAGKAVTSHGMAWHHQARAVPQCGTRPHGTMCRTSGSPWMASDPAQPLAWTGPSPQPNQSAMSLLTGQGHCGDPLPPAPLSQKS